MSVAVTTGARASMMSVLFVLAHIAPVWAEPRARLDVRGACPTADAVSGSLTQLLPTLRWADDGIVLSVVDRGERFVVHADRSDKTFSDPARDCAERARVAAIFANAVLAPPVVAPPAADAPVSYRRRAVPAQVQLDLGGSFDAAPRRSPNDSLLSGGGSARLYVGTQHVGAVLGIAALSPVTLDFAAANARVLRIPLDASVRGRLHIRRWELSLDLGFSATPFVVQASGLMTNKRSTSADFGLRAAPRVAYWLARRVALYISARAVIVPAPQTLRVETLGVVGTTPYVWLGAEAGIVIALH